MRRMRRVGRMRCVRRMRGEPDHLDGASRCSRKRDERARELAVDCSGGCADGTRHGCYGDALGCLSYSLGEERATATERGTRNPRAALFLPVAYGSRTYLTVERWSPGSSAIPAALRSARCSITRSQEDSHVQQYCLSAGLSVANQDNATTRGSEAAARPIRSLRPLHGGVDAGSKNLAAGLGMEYRRCLSVRDCEAEPIAIHVEFERLRVEELELVLDPVNTTRFDVIVSAPVSCVAISDPTTTLWPRTRPV